MNIFDRLALEKEGDYWKTDPGYEAPKYQSAQANLYSDNARHYLAGPNKAGAEKPIQYMNGAQASYEQGPSAEDKDTFKKAKLTRSQVFDGSGETLTETNLSEDGVETKVVKKTPSSLLDNESYDTPILGNDEVTYPSIATPPQSASPMIQFAQTGGLLENTPELAEVNKKVLTDMASSMGISLTELAQNKEFIQTFGGRYDNLLVSPNTTDAYSGELLNGRPIFPPEMRASGMPPEFIRDGSYFGNMIRNPVYDDWIAKGRGVENLVNPTHQPGHGAINLITDSEVYPNTAEGKLNAAISKTPSHMVEKVWKALEIDTDTPITAESFEAEVTRQTALETIAAENSTPLFDSKGQVIDSTFANLDINEITKDVEKEATTDITSKKDEDVVVDAITEIKNTNPEGIKVLNEFALWSDTVSDEVAIKEAEDYLQNLKDSPSVDKRFRKAMAIGMLAMLFGDDFTTAMNTGFGVVADDYAAEEAAEAAEAATAAELAKTVAKENRANIENDRRKLRDFTLEMEKLRVEKGVEAAKEAEAEVKARTSGNQDWIKDQGTHYESILTDDQKKSIGPYNFEFEYDRALQTVKRLQPNVVWDLKNNNDQRVAFNTQFEKWFSDKTNPSNNFGKGVPAFANYMQDAFIKIRMEEDSPLSMKDTNPSVDDLRGMGINTDDINFKAGMEATNGAYSKIQSYSEGFNERGTLVLMAKDYYDWQKSKPEEHAEMVERANQQGIGGFIWYVNKHVKALDQIGTKYDPDFVGKSNQERTDFAIKYLIDKGIVVTPKK